MSAGAVIKKLRLKCCLPQADFAKEIGVTRSSICNYEKDRRIPQLRVIKKIKDYAEKHGMKYTTDDFLK